jgi:2-keto-4-pentenoate hydratase
MTDDTEAARLTAGVDRFIAARRARPTWTGVAAPSRPATLEAGYRLQDAVYRQLEQGGNRRLGYKVAASSKLGQLAWMLDEPLYAGIFADTQYGSLQVALAAPLADGALECEVAVRLGADLDGSRPLDRADVAGAIESCHLACEIIDRRCGPPEMALVPTYLVDDFFHAGFVLGPALPNWRALDLARLEGSITVGAEVTHGVPGEPLDPLASLLWLAGALARHGKVLRRGEIVLTGTLVNPVPVKSPYPAITLAISGFTPLCS